MDNQNILYAETIEELPVRTLVEVLQEVKESLELEIKDIQHILTEKLLDASQGSISVEELLEDEYQEMYNIVEVVQELGDRLQEITLKMHEKILEGS